jgi:hypothetical protein
MLQYAMALPSLSNENLSSETVESSSDRRKPHHWKGKSAPGPFSRAEIEAGAIGRTEAAKRLGITKKRFMLQFEARLEPTKDGKGRYRFDAAKLEELAKKLKPAPTVPPAAWRPDLDGPTEAAVLQLLVEEGLDVVAVSIRMKLRLVQVEAVRKMLAQVRGSILLPSEALREIEKLPWRGGPAELKTSADLLEALRDTVAPERCSRCKKQGACFCEACAGRMVAGAQPSRRPTPQPLPQRAPVPTPAPVKRPPGKTLTPEDIPAELRALAPSLGPSLPSDSPSDET